MPENPIYKFLKTNNLTQKDEASFIKEYSNESKAQELYGFLKENKLTEKDFGSFYGDYFAKKVSDADLGNGMRPLGSGSNPFQSSQVDTQAPTVLTPQKQQEYVQKQQTERRQLSDQLNVAKNAFRGAQGEEVVEEIESFQPQKESFREPEKDPSFLQSISNTGSNIVTGLQQFIPNTQIALGDGLTQVLGKDFGGAVYSNITKGGNVDVQRAEAYQALADLEPQFKQTRGLIESGEKFDVPGLAAATIDAVGALVRTAVTSIPTAGFGLYSEMVGSSVANYNKQKAKSLGMTVNELYEKGENDYFVPATIGGVGAQMEKIGLKGVQNAINKQLTVSTAKKMALLFNDVNKEGLTEWLQTGLEKGNTSLASGKDAVDSGVDAVSEMFSKKGLESYLMGVVGSGGAAGLGRIAKGMTNPKNKAKVEADVATINRLTEEIVNPDTSPSTKAFVEKQIRSKVADVASTIDEDADSVEKFGAEQKQVIQDLQGQIAQAEEVTLDPALTPETKVLAEEEVKTLNKELETVLKEKPKLTDKDAVIEEESKEVIEPTEIIEEQTLIEEPNAIQISETESLLQRQQGEVGETGSERRPLESGEQRNEVTEETISEEVPKSQEEKVKPGALFKKQKVFATLGNKKVEITSLEDASAKQQELLAKTESKGADLPYLNIDIVNENGEVVAHISQNGKIWEGKETGKTNKKLLYDPSAKDKVETIDTEFEEVPISETKEEVAETILDRDTDLKGNEKAEFMYPATFTESKRVGDEVEFINRQGEKMTGNYRGTNPKGDAIIDRPTSKDGKKFNLTFVIPENEVTFPKYQDTGIGKGDKDAIAYAIENGLYQKAIANGEMTANDAVKIIKSAGLEVPKDILNPPTDIKSKEKEVVKVIDKKAEELKRKSSAPVSKSEPTPIEKAREARIKEEPEVEKKAGDPLRNLADKIEQGKINKLGGFRASTGFDAVWDGSLTVVAQSLRTGAELADAIESGLKYIRKTDWYKNLTDKKDFESKYKAHLESEYADEVKEQPKAKEQEKEKEVSGIKKALVSDEIIANVNLDKISDKEMLELGKKLVETGEIKPANIVLSIAKGTPRALQPKEVVALIYYKATLDNQRRELLSEYNKKVENGQSVADIALELDEVQTNTDLYDVMAVITANQQSLAFRLRKGLLDKDYNLVTQIEQYKKVNSGVIPAEVEARFRELDKQLTELKEKLKEAEQREIEAEEVKSVKNIIEDVERTKSTSKRRDSLTPQEKARKKELAKKYNVFNDITRIATIVAEKDFREYARLIFKEAKGDFVEFGRELIKNVGSDIKEFLPQLYKDLGGKGEANITDLTQKPFVKDGELVIPNDFIREAVEQGNTDINTLAEAVKKAVESELPDVTIRAVRDAITKYGRTVNQTKDVVQQQINEAKRLGRLYSELEDLQNKKAKEKSGKVFNKITDKERELKRQIRLLENGLPKTPEQRATEAAERSIKKRIDALNEAISKKTKILPKNSLVINTPEIEQLRQTRDILQQQYDALNNPPKKTTAEKATEAAVRATKKRLDELTEAVANSAKIAPKGTNVVETPELKQLREERDAMQALYDDLINPKRTEEEIRRDKRKKYIEKFIEEKKERLRTGNFAPKPKPTPIAKDSEIIRLETEANKIRDEYDAAHYDNEQANRSTFKKTTDTIKEWGTGLSRALVAGLDFGFFLVQGIISVGSSHPMKTFYAVHQSLLAGLGTNANPLTETRRFFRELGSEKVEREQLANLKAQPYYPILKATKVAIQEPNAKLGERDDALQASVINKVWNFAMLPLKYINPKAYEVAVKANPWRAGERAYTGASNAIRVQMFLDLARALEQKGISYEDSPELYKIAANTANNMTFRGRLRFAEPIAAELNMLYFSARKVTASLSLVNPAYWVDLAVRNPIVAKRALLKMATFIGVASSVTLALQAFSDDEDEEQNPDMFNPYSSDFMTYRLGNTRLNFFGGLGGNVVLFARMLTANYKTTSLSKIKTLGQDSFTPNRKELLETTLFANKLNPMAGVGYTFLNQSVGREIDWESEAVSSVSPLWAQNISELQKEHPYVMATFLSYMSFMGQSINTYGTPEFIDRRKDKKIFDLIQDKNASFSEKTRSNVDVVDINTGDVRDITKAEFEVFQKEYGGYIKKYLKDNVKELSKMPVSQVEKEMTNLKTRATKHAKEVIAGFPVELKSYHEGEEIYELNPKQLKLRVKYYQEFLKDNKEAYDSESDLKKDARSYSKDMLQSEGYGVDSEGELKINKKQ